MYYVLVQFSQNLLTAVLCDNTLNKGILAIIFD